MILIGEKLNSSIPRTLEAFESGSEEAVAAIIRAQAEAGASYLDINTALCADELGKMLWVIGLVKRHSECGVMIDTADPSVMAKAVQEADGRALILNSTTISDRFAEVVPLAVEKGAAVVGLPIDDEGMPHSLEDKCRKLDALVEKLRAAGIPDERIFADVLIETLATSNDSAKTALRTVAYMAERYPQVNTVCGLSNVSFGLPRRALINSAFLSAAYAAGLSSAIIDPASPAMRGAIAAARVVAGEDDYCMEYITYIRSLEE